MLPLDTVTNGGELKNASSLAFELDQLKGANVDGFMVDVWWGITEPAPKSYNFTVYHQLVTMAKTRGMKVQFVASFHECGGNVGDNCHIPLPSFINQTRGIWYKDREGNENKEYISLFADKVPIQTYREWFDCSRGRTPLQMYRDWFVAFTKAFYIDLGITITEVQVGMGPAGELRYPAYPLKHWKFCGVGEFQAWDTHALASLKAAAAAVGHPEWQFPPSDAGNYNSQPSEAPFFHTGFISEYGLFFLDWYFSALKKHGAAVLGAARAALKAVNGTVAIVGKVAGIYWWYKSPHHAAELTAGYYNTNQRDAYAEIAEVFAKKSAAIDFTCLEMSDFEQPWECDSGPEGLVRQVQTAAHAHDIAFNGENALPRYEDAAYNKILSYQHKPGGLHGFTYLRLDKKLLQDNNFKRFRNFVNQMHGKKEIKEKVVEVPERFRRPKEIQDTGLPELLSGNTAETGPDNISENGTNDTLLSSGDATDDGDHGAATPGALLPIVSSGSASILHRVIMVLFAAVVLLPLLFLRGGSYKAYVFAGHLWRRLWNAVRPQGHPNQRRLGGQVQMPARGAAMGTSG